MQNKKYSRQFVMSPIPSDKFAGFQETMFGNHYVYVHSLLPFKKVDAGIVKIILFGYIIDPYHTDWHDEDILLHICNNTKTVDDVAELLYPLSGRFALFIEINEQLFVFHDPCGFRTVTYTKTDKGLIFGSDEQIINEVITLKKGEKFAEYENSELKKTFENFLFAGVSLYEDVYKLVANHYLETDTVTQVRFFPNKKILKTNDIESVANKSIEIIKGEFLALANRNKNFAFTITAGRDSRLLMAFVDNVYNNVFYYTMSYWNRINNHHDLRVPAKILKKRKIPHHIFDCTNPSSENFLNIYMKNSTMAHKEWCDIAYGMDKYYPTERLNIKGVASEIVTCYIHPQHKNDEYVENYNEFTSNGLYIPLVTSFNVNALKKWFEDAKNIQEKCNISPYDLFEWEQRMSSWQAQSQLEWDIVQESYVPYNNRELLFTMLTLHKDYRIKKTNKLYKLILQKQNPFLLKYSYDNEKKGLLKIFQLTNEFVKRVLRYFIKKCRRFLQ